MITQTTAMSDEQIDSGVQAILSGIEGASERDFQLASMEYNSVFFRDYPLAFKVRACRALAEAFPGNVNNFWSKTAQNEFF